VSAQAVTPTAAPSRRLSVPEQFFISVHWFGLNFHWGALLAVAIPAEVLKFVPGTEKGRALAAVFAGGALIALVVLPLMGALSDRALFRLGRRRPFIIAGTLLNVAALLALGYAPTFALFVLAYWFVQSANNLGGSAYGGLIPDLVPQAQRGVASGLMGLMTMLGTITAALIAGQLMQRGLTIPLYLTISAVLLATMGLTVWRVREEPLRARPQFRWREFLAQFWINPREHPDFGWLFVSRFLAMMGFYTILTFLQFFLKDFLRVPRFTEATGTLTATDVLPSQASAAKDLGIWGISVTLPQVIAPLVGGPLLDGMNRLGPNLGYVALMLVAAGYFVAGSLAVWKITGAR